MTGSDPGTGPADGAADDESAGDDGPEPSENGPADDGDLDAELKAAVDRAAAAVTDGGLVLYPTETVYGLGADALDAAAVERVFAVKGRDRSDPLSLAVPSVAAAREYAAPTDREARFMQAFLPGPVTIVVERRDRVPDALVAGGDRVGIRVPDHPVALSLLDRAAPLTATSANLSGTGGVRRIDALDAGLLDVVDATIDAGETPGGGSTVVDPGSGEIHRRGALADEVAAWLDANPPRDC